MSDVWRPSYNGVDVCRGRACDCVSGRCPARVPHTSVKKMSSNSKSVLPQCQVRASCKSVRQACQVRVPHKSAK